MELKEYLQTLRKWWWLIVVCTLCAALTSFIVSSILPPVYEARVLIVSNQSQNSGILDYSSLLGGQRMIETYREMLKTRPVLETVIANLALPYTPRELSKLVQVKIIPETQLLELMVEDNDPQRAADIANEIAFTFLVQRSTEQQLEEIEGYESRVVTHMEALEQTIQETRNELEQVRASPALQAQEDLADLYTNQSSQQAAYANLLATYVNLRAMKSRLLDLTIAESAHPPAEPTRPRKVLNTGIAGLSGGMIACATAFLLEYLNDTMDSAEELQETLSLPNLGTIPAVRSWQTNGHTGSQTSEWPIGEAFRILRTNIQFANVDSTVQTLLITSSEPGEGKTSVLANLGTVLAQSGHRVLLIDADLRRSGLHQHFGIPNRTGLTSLLLNNAGQYEGIIETDTPNLYVLPSGPTPPNPSELLGSQRMAQLIASFKSFGDIVLFDAPPVLACADAMVLASQVDGVVFVVDSRSTHRDTARRAMDMLRNAKARVLGGVLNKVSAKTSGYSYYYYYSDDGNGDKSLWTWLRDRVVPVGRNIK